MDDLMKMEKEGLVILFCYCFRNKSSKSWLMNLIRLKTIKYIIRFNWKTRSRKQSSWKMISRRPRKTLFRATKYRYASYSLRSKICRAKSTISSRFCRKRQS